MEKSDLALIERYKNSDHDLAKLWEKHLQLEEKITELEKIPSEGEVHFEINELKKKKLQGRDKLEVILEKYRNS